jgi:hypothetical protein
VLLREGWISAKTDGDDRSRSDRMAHATDSGADVQTAHPRDPTEVWAKGRGQRDYSRTLSGSCQTPSRRFCQVVSSIIELIVGALQMEKQLLRRQTRVN